MSKLRKRDTDKIVTVAKFVTNAGRYELVKILRQQSTYHRNQQLKHKAEADRLEDVVRLLRRSNDP